jgi:23S rRNA pseudouridine2605 synthase
MKPGKSNDRRDGGRAKRASSSDKPSFKSRKSSDGGRRHDDDDLSSFFKKKEGDEGSGRSGAEAGSFKSSARSGFGDARRKSDDKNADSPWSKKRKSAGNDDDFAAKSDRKRKSDDDRSEWSFDFDDKPKRASSEDDSWGEVSKPRRSFRDEGFDEKRRPYSERRRQDGDEGSRGKRFGSSERSDSGDRRREDGDLKPYRSREKDNDRNDRGSYERKDRSDFSERRGSSYRDERSDRGGFRKDRFDGGERREGGFRKEGSFGDDRREGGFRRERSENGDRREGGFRRERSEGDDRREGGFRKERSFGDDRRKGGYSSERASGDKRKPYGDKPSGSGRRSSDGYRSSDRKSGREGSNRANAVKALVREDMRLNKYLSNAGICSRREADILISTGVVTVNGTVVTEMGFRVKPGDTVVYGGQAIKPEKNVYLLLNKPKDFITTNDDPQNRKTVMHLVEGACKERIYSVGRLDRNTTGLLLMTNDGNLADLLSHPSSQVRKIYHVTLDKNISAKELNQMVNEGIELEDGNARADEAEFVEEDSRKEVGITLHSGKNRIVRRMFEALGYNVIKLDRVSYAGLTKKDLPRGRWRMLSEKEVGFLRMNAKGK